MHFTGHGWYNNDKNEYSLSFEKEIGELEGVSAKYLKEILSIYPAHKKIKLAFVNSCYSGGIGPIFLEGFSFLLFNFNF